jgi:hypothetical protein
MWKKIEEFFEKAMSWIKALWEKHDEQLLEMIVSVLPMVIEVALRPDLSGEQKRKAIVDAIVDNAEVAAEEISTSMLNEAVEIAANKYNIHLGKLTVEKMDAATAAATKAARDFADGKLQITGKEAEDAGVSLSNEGSK